MRDVGTEERVELGAERIDLVVEGRRGHGIVGFASAIDAGDEQLVEVFDAFDAGRCELVDQRRVFGTQRARRRNHVGPIAAVAFEVLQELVAVDAFGRLEILHARAVALFPMAHEVAQQRCGPRDAALEKAKVEIGEPSRDAAHDQRLGRRVMALAEHADVVVDVARDRAAVGPTHRRGMKTRRDVEFTALGPHRVVVVLAVVAEGVGPQRPRREVGVLLGNRGHRSLHEVRHHDGLEPELPDRVLELGDGLFWRMHRDLGDGDHAIGELGKQLGVESVERATRPAAVVFGGEMGKQQADARIDHTEVHAQFVEAVVEQAG